MSDGMTPRQVLVGARNYLGEGSHRWTKGVMKDGRGGVCSIGAIDHISPATYQECTWVPISPTLKIPVYMTPTYAPERKKAQEYLVAVIGTSIPSWNDAMERTYAEVLAAFDRAIVLATLDEQTVDLAPLPDYDGAGKAFVHEFLYGIDEGGPDLEDGSTTDPAADRLPERQQPVPLQVLSRW